MREKKFARDWVFIFRFPPEIAGKIPTWERKNEEIHFLFRSLELVESIGEHWKWRLDKNVKITRLMDFIRTNKNWVGIKINDCGEFNQECLFNLGAIEIPEGSSRKK